MGYFKGQPPFVGTRNGICIYKRGDQYYSRARSTLSSDRVKTSPEFRKTMENASYLARASRIASAIYKELREKEFPHYRILTGQAMLLLKEGKGEEEVINTLRLRWEKWRMQKS